MSKKSWLNHLTLILTGVLFVQFSVGTLIFSREAKADQYPQLNGLIGQLNPNDPCAWWNTTSPSNCSQTNNNSTNPDPWNWGGDDPTWNPNGPDNGDWGSPLDPSNSYTNGWTSPGELHVPALLGYFKGAIAANYTQQVSEDLNENAVWNANSLDDTADMVIDRTSRFLGTITFATATGFYLLNSLYLMGTWKSIIRYVGASFGSAVAITLVESFALGEQQLVMALELMELYGQLGTNLNIRQQKVVGMIALTLFESLAIKGGSVLLRLPDLDAPPPVPVPPNLPVSPVSPSEAVISDGGLAASNITRTEADAVISGTAPKATYSRLIHTILAKLWPSLEKKVFDSKTIQKLKAASELIPDSAKLVMAAGLFGILAGVGMDLITKYTGRRYKRILSAAAARDKLKAIHTLEADPDATPAIWLLLTKFVFKPAPGQQALTMQDAKLYASIVSQQFPLIHTKDYDQSADVFNAYKAVKLQQVDASFPSNGSSNQNKKQNNSDKNAEKKKENLNIFGENPPKDEISDPNGFLNQSGKPNNNTPIKFSNEIDRKLIRLNTYLNEREKLYFIQVIECGMLMKGFLSGADSTALETIAIELGLTPPKTQTTNIVVKPDDPRYLKIEHYKALRNGLKEEVERKAKALAVAQGVPPNQFKDFEMNLPPGDVRYFSGEIMLEDFNDPILTVQKNYEYRTDKTGVVDQNDKKYWDKLVTPVIEGDKKLPMPTKLPPHFTNDGSPYPWDKTNGSMMIR